MDIELQKILNDINVLDKLCDAVRFVDPLGKGVIDHSFDGAEFGGVRCFDKWGQSRVCENCISMRAFNDDTT